MKSLVIYSSKTSNTKKLAEAAKEILGCEMCGVEDAPDLGEYEQIAMGFWFQGGGPDAATAEFLPKLAGKKLFLFATHGAKAGSELAKNGLNKAAGLATGADITGMYSCPGEVPAPVQEKLAKKNPPPPWLADAPAAQGHPDESDINGLKEMLQATL